MSRDVVVKGLQMLIEDLQEDRINGNIPSSMAYFCDQMNIITENIADIAEDHNQRKELLKIAQQYHRLAKAFKTNPSTLGAFYWR